MTVPSRNDIADQIAKAYRALDDAKETVAQRRLETATSRAYYAIFYAARAVLWRKGLAAKTHKGVAMLFDQHFVSPGLVDRSYRDILKDASDEREYADYLSLTDSLDQMDVEKLVKNACRFVEQMERVIDEAGSDDSAQH